MFKNVASQKITLLAIDTAANTPKTGDASNLTAYVSKDDGAVTVLGDTSATELDATNAPGLYSFDLTQSETNADKLVFSGKSSTSGIRIVPVLVYTFPAYFSSLGINSSGDVSRVTLVDTTTTNTDMITAAGIRSAVGMSSADLDAQLAAFDALLDSILADTGTDGVVLSAAMCNRIADHVRRRQQANVEASSDGDTLSLASLYGLIQQAQDSSVSGGTLTVKKTDGSTTLGTMPVTSNASADPITGIG